MHILSSQVRINIIIFVFRFTAFENSIVCLSSYDVAKWLQPVKTDGNKTPF